MSCRKPQTDLLGKLLNVGSTACPSAIGVHGPRGTGKTTTIREYLSKQSNSELTYSWVQCDQCLTARVLLQRALRRIFTATRCADLEDAVCENVDIFLSIIREKFVSSEYKKLHVLVLDKIDDMPDYRAMSDLFTCLSRIPELTGGLSNLCVVFIYSTAEPRALLTNLAVPHIWFPRFSPEDAHELLRMSQIDICRENSSLDDVFKSQYLELVMKALGPVAGTDVVRLKRTARKIWPEFSHGVTDNDSVAKVYMQRAKLFSADRLIDRLGDQSRHDRGLEVSPVSCFLLCAAYLASYNSPRYDMRYFSLAKTMRNKRRETKPKKSLAIPVRSLAPPAFEMERLLAIFHAIHPMSFEFHPSVNIGRELATLEAQNLVTKSMNDPLDSRTKWKINVPWSYIQRIAEQISFNIEDYLVEV